MEIALTAHGLEEFTVVPLTTLDQWCQNENLLARIVLLYHLNDLLFGIFHHGLARDIAERLSGTGKEQTHIVVNLRGGAHGRARILVGGLLLDADDRRETCNLVDIGTFHATQKIASVGRERLDIAALSFGKDGVKSQRRLTTTAKTGNDCQRVAWYLDINILQIVDTGPEDLNLFHEQ